MKQLILTCLSIVCCLQFATAQNTTLSEAQAYVIQKDYQNAIPILEKLHEQNPLDVAIYESYLKALIGNKDFKEAETLVGRQMKRQPLNTLLYIDMGRIFLQDGKKKKAEEQFDLAISKMTGDDMITTKMASRFIDLEQMDYAIKTYERGIEILRNPFLYGNALARLYARQNEMEKAISMVLDGGIRRFGGHDDAKSLLLEMLGNDPKKLQLTQKALLKKINEQPGNIYYSELLTWLYTQKNDWKGAFLQIRAIDARNKESGQRLMDFANLAKKEKQYDAAIEALDAVMDKGEASPLYAKAAAEKLDISMLQLEENIAFTPEDIQQLQKEFAAYFDKFPEMYASETLRQYARLEALYAHQVDTAIGLLQKAIAQPNASKIFTGEAKLQLGDYYILADKVWDASLSYSQVDKAFKEDMLGEEARFRNAKLAYYRGDFEWAEGQLSVLKASTSELIANDALYLSVLIIENIPPDSNLVPLQQFAHADLLLFQNKDQQAITLLDSISQAYPKHPLNDDILMLRADLAIKHRKYEQALSYYNEVIKNYGEDVLADDALYKTATLHEKYLNKPGIAKKFYEDLIIKYPGSTYVQVARGKVNVL